VSHAAYRKILLHTWKYPHHSVNGILVGRISESVECEEKGKSKHGEQQEERLVNITDYFPLFHGHTLAPMLEMAMLLIEEYCEKEGVEVVGYFHANELYDDRELGALAHRIAHKMLKNYPHVCVLLFDPLLSKEMKLFALRGFAQEHQRWEEKDSHFQLEEGFAWDGLQHFLAENCCMLNDFDNHLEDASHDWLNARFNTVA